jgi:tetraacyldisaccharide 4'-kinase
MQAPDFWRTGGPLAAALSPLGCLWAVAGRLRLWLGKAEAAGVPVVCIGNAVAGGAGKTPVALAVAAELMRAGRKPHFLSRGYGGSLTGPVRVDPDVHGAREVGDEPLLLAALAPTWVARDRIAGAKAAAAAGAGTIVMDDGLQNTALRKDMSLLVVDGGYGFGNGRVMPAGPLREPVAEVLRRVAAVVVVGEDRTGVGSAVGHTLPVLSARFVPLPDGGTVSGRRVVAFAGIGRPQKFFETLAGMGCELVSEMSFPDHHDYSEDEVMRLVEEAAAAGAVPVTTEKDAVRLPDLARGMVETVRVTLEWGDPDAFRRLVAALPPGEV